MATPQSVINVCNGVPLNNRYEHTVYFSSQDAQEEYFAGKVVKTFPAYTFLRKSWSIKVESTMAMARGWSYLYFKNPGSDNKTYYYFITNIEYVNDSTVELFLEMDVMQTYFFDYSLLESFVDREHVWSDQIGEHTTDEDLETGDYTTVDVNSEWLGLMVCMVMATFDPLLTTQENTETVMAGNYNNVFSGLGVYAVESKDYAAWGTKLAQLDEWGKSDGIISMWMYPKELVELADGFSWSDGNVCKPVKGANTTLYHDTSRNNVLSGDYTPRNNKLYTYPYNFLYATNNNGVSAVYKYERFGVPAFCNFRVVGSISPDANVHVYPLNYNGVQHNYESGISIGGFPTCAWNQDVYKLWLAQNQNQHLLTAATATVKAAAGAAAMVLVPGAGAAVGAGMVASGATQISGLLAQRKDREIQPPQAKGSASSSVAVTNGFQEIQFQKKSVNAEHAKIIDDYFDMYGYKCNRVKVPNTKVRENWTYTKTVNCHIRGNFCTEDQNKIESIYNNGITFWVNGDFIGDYSKSNNPLG